VGASEFYLIRVLNYKFRCNKWEIKFFKFTLSINRLHDDDCRVDFPVAPRFFCVIILCVRIILMREIGREPFTATTKQGVNLGSFFLLPHFKIENQRSKNFEKRKCENETQSSTNYKYFSSSSTRHIIFSSKFFLNFVCYLIN
jgi:hypothetical protein